MTEPAAGNGLDWKGERLEPVAPEVFPPWPPRHVFVLTQGGVPIDDWRVAIRDWRYRHLFLTHRTSGFPAAALTDFGRGLVWALQVWDHNEAPYADFLKHHGWDYVLKRTVLK